MAKTNEKKSEYNLFQKIFYNKTIAQINGLSAKIDDYEKFLSSSKKLQEELKTTISYVKETYAHAKDGIKCSDIDAQIDKIDGYCLDISNIINELEIINVSINDEIENINNQIVTLRASIN